MPDPSSPWIAAGLTEAPNVTVVALQIAPAHGDELVVVDQIKVEAGQGVIGDRYYGTRHRHISVQSATALSDASAELGRALAPSSTRRTVTVSGGEIPTTPGSRLRLGSVEVEVVRIAAPCRLMDEINGAGTRRALHGRGGSVCRVLSTSTLTVGDSVDLEA